MGDAEDGAPRLVGQAFDLPAVGENNLLDHGQPQASARLLSRKIRFEDFAAAVRGNAGAIVTDFEDGFGGTALLGDDLNFAVPISGLDGVED